MQWMHTWRGGWRTGTDDDDLADVEDLALGSLSGTISPFAKTLTMVETMIQNFDICRNKFKFHVQVQSIAIKTSETKQEISHKHFRFIHTSDRFFRVTTHQILNLFVKLITELERLILAATLPNNHTLEVLIIVCPFKRCQGDPWP